MREVPPARTVGEDSPLATVDPSTAKRVDRAPVRPSWVEARGASIVGDEGKMMVGRQGPRDYRRQWMAGSPPASS